MNWRLELNLTTAAAIWSELQHEQQLLISESSQMQIWSNLATVTTIVYMCVPPTQLYCNSKRKPTQIWHRPLASFLSTSPVPVTSQIDLKVYLGYNLKHRHDNCGRSLITRTWRGGQKLQKLTISRCSRKTTAIFGSISKFPNLLFFSHPKTCMVPISVPASRKW